MLLKSGTALLFAVSLGLVPSLAFAADAPKTPLAPGGAASVKTAEHFTDNTTVMIAGGALIIGGIALVASSDDSSSHPATTPATGTTGTH